MSSCLVALGSNLGDREATLQAALAALDAAPSVRVLRHSRTHRSPPLGMPDSSREFLNQAALLETTLAPAALLAVLQQIESEHGRGRAAHWADRTLDLDLLLYDDREVDTPELTVPHPRMSFRRFVLDPAAEIAGDWLHPVLGWTIGQLRRHLDEAADLAAIVSEQESDRHELAGRLCKQFDLQIVDPPALGDAARLWPRELTAWIRIPAAPSGDAAHAGAAKSQKTSYLEAQQPKLTIVLEGGRPGQVDWASFVREPGRGPTLRTCELEPRLVEQDAAAALQAVWPHLGPAGPIGLK